MPFIEIKNLKKNYLMGKTTVEALRGIDLNIEKNEFVSIWGPSGSGKSTLLNIIGTIDQPTSGQLILDSMNIRTSSDNALTEFRNKTIGFVFQQFNLIPVFSALENVMLPLHIQGISKKQIKEKAMQRLEEVNIAQFSHHRPDRLSGGQQQRVAIARALVTDPSLVIADEPTANLDSNTAQSIVRIMRKLNIEKKITFIFSTHDQRLLDQVDRKILLEDGKVRDSGVPNYV